MGDLSATSNSTLSSSQLMCGSRRDKSCHGLVGQIEISFDNFRAQYKTFRGLCKYVIDYYHHSSLGPDVNVFCINNDILSGPSMSPTYAQYLRRKDFTVQRHRGWGWVKVGYTLNMVVLFAPRGISWMVTNTGDGGWDNWGLAGGGAGFDKIAHFQ